MDSTQEHPQQSGHASGELHGLRANSKASAEELREFFAGLRGKTPQEAVGIVAQSGLAQGIAWATCAFAVVLCAFTLIPYMMRDADGGSSQTSKQKQSQPALAEPEPVQGQPQDSTPINTTTPDVQQAGTVMGIDETKTPDPTVNPLDKDIDSLLDIDN